MHAVLVRDDATVRAIQEWHSASDAGAIVLLSAERGPAREGGTYPLEQTLRVEDPAAARWVRALLGGSEVLDPSGRALRRSNGAVLLSGGGAPSGPLRRRAELEALAGDLQTARTTLTAAEHAVETTVARLAELESALATATEAAERARDAERTGGSARDEAERSVATRTRELQEAEAQVVRITDRLAASESRMGEVDAALTEGELSKVRLDEALSVGRQQLAELETEQESAREARVHWQVQLAHVEARLLGAGERLARAEQVGQEAAGSAAIAGR